MTDKTVPQSGHVVPAVFTRDMLDWLPWLEPVAADRMTERQLASLVDAARVKSDYFRLLARDPDVLEARTRTDKDIFYNPDAGLPRAERELAAADDVAAERLHLLRLGPCPVRGDLFQAGRRRRQAPGRGRRRRSRQALERDRRGVGGADRDADLLRAAAHRCAARGRAGRRRHRRRDQRRVVLQLGQPTDAVAGRADSGGALTRYLSLDSYSSPPLQGERLGETGVAAVCKSGQAPRRQDYCDIQNVSGL